ncbi:Uncharacterized protein DAT39_003158 [Clarias magur]|uniref:Uncharacterized protein n=1 Tax=Clarias magur TaxID=1594786 RepID=A0A8J4X9X2_CLAMG|nr:Uncharacterized protein DAT39_003158 [Clarias magur]
MPSSGSSLSLSMLQSDRRVQGGGHRESEARNYNTCVSMISPTQRTKTEHIKSFYCVFWSSLATMFYSKTLVEASQEGNASRKKFLHKSTNTSSDIRFLLKEFWCSDSGLFTPQHNPTSHSSPLVLHPGGSWCISSM